MANNLDRLMKAAGAAVDTAAKATSGLVARGKDKAESYVLQNRLAKMQRQLGTLVYTLHKTGREDETMLEWYFTEIDRIKLEMTQTEPPLPQEENINICPKCGMGIKEGTQFCGRCGEKLP